VAITGALPCTEGRPTRCHCECERKMFFGPRDTSDLISIISFTFAMRRHLIRLASAPFASFRLAKFGWIRFADLRVQRLATKQNAEFTQGAPKLLFEPVCGPKFMKFWNIVEDPSYFQMLSPDCLCHVCFRRYSPLRVEVVEKPNKCKSCWHPIILGEVTPPFLWQIVSAVYRPPLGKVWLRSVAELRLRSLAMK